MNRIAINLMWVIGLLVGSMGVGHKLYAQTPTINLTAHQSAVSPPASATLEWHNALPISATNLITGVQTTSATPGTYYAVYNYGGSPVCYSQPSYLRILTNMCPDTTVDLKTAVDLASTPANTTITFHSSATVSAGNEMVSTTVTASSTETVYYIAYKTFNAATNSYCYSNASPVVVILTPCCRANVAPTLSVTSKTNTCPAPTVDLTTITASNTPTSTTLTWHSTIPVSVTTEITSISSVTAGTYYAAFKGVNSGSACYGPTTSVVVTLTVCPQAPIAIDDINNTNVNIPVSGNVLTNDTDPLGLPLSVSVSPGCAPTSGTVVMSANGTYTYTPAMGFVGSVSFCYQVCNSAGLCSTAVVGINVVAGPIVGQNNPPVANNDASLTYQGVAVKIAVLANDTDPDSNTSGNGQLGTPVLLGGVSAGSAVVNGDKTITYTPPVGFTGVATFRYLICDQGSPSLCDTAVVSVNVLPTPPAGTTLSPIAVDDALLTLINTAKTGSLAVNDTDPNNPPLALTYTAGSFTTAHGTIVVSSNGSYTYTPNNGYVGPDNYPYTVCNTAGKCANATLDILVQQPIYQAPVATPDIANTNINTPVSGNVLTNDSDPQGLPLTVGLLGQPLNGTVTLSPNGSYTYTPPVGFTGVATFCYSVSNTVGLSSTACVTVNVNPVVTVQNNAPIANNDNTQTTAGKSLTINVVANDTDPDSISSLNGQLGNPTLLSQPSVGTAVVNLDGTVSYTPPVGFTGVVSFPYQVCDKGTPVLCSTAVVSVNVLPAPPVGTTLAPVAVDDALLTQVNMPKAGSVATNDSDPNSPPLLLSYTTGQPVNGTVVMSANGSYTYTPAPGYVGPDSFTYLACNTAGLCDKATVSVLVQVALGLKLLPKAWLQGALFNVTNVGGVMRDDLRIKNLIPSTSPYSSFSAITSTNAISNTATVFGVTGNDAIVDWVFVELRSPSNMSLVVDSRAALIQRDGDIVEIDGTSPILFNNVTEGNYFVSVRHRNHLGVMTATAIPLSATGTVVDFRDPQTPTYRVSASAINQAQVTVVQGVALWAGNVVADKTVIYQGTNNDVSAISVQVKGATKPDGTLYNITGSPFYILNGYYNGDVNMDGRTIYQGTSNDVNFIYLNVTRNHPGNVAGQNIFIIREQLP